jgi:uncharacterized membrane-anchored protein YhcB (DUF1043 family)
MNYVMAASVAFIVGITVGLVIAAYFDGRENKDE